MNIGNYIHQLLLENDMVIIPGFGAFISTYKPAEINSNTKEIKPPSKEISFNQQIRNNDGLLVGRVAEGEVISHFDALKEIEKERENIIYQLDKGERVLLEETGELFINDAHEIQLESIQNENLLLDSFGLEPVSVEEIAEDNEMVVSIEDNTKPEKEELIIEPSEESKQEPELEIPIPISDVVPEKEEKKKRSWLWLLLILAPIILVGIYISTKNTDEKISPVKTIDESKLSVEDYPIVSPDTTLKDSISEPAADTTLIQEIVPLPIETTAYDSPKFYLIGGSFKSEENANTYLIQLKDEGYKPFHLGKKGNFYVVGIGTYSTEKEALNAREDFYEKYPGSGIWILEE